MKKKIQHLFSQEKLIKYTLFGVFFFVAAHTFIFFGNQFLVYRYDTLYAETTGEGVLVDMPENFQRAKDITHKQSFLTRTDILLREAKILESGLHLLINQYRIEVDSMYDAIVGNMQALRTLLEISESTVFPERGEVLQHAEYLETQINAAKETREKSLKDLETLSRDYVAKANVDFEKAKKVLVIQDIESLQHEITFINSVYRVSGKTRLVFSPKVFNKLYVESFSEKQLETDDSETLRTAWKTLSDLLDPYRVESSDIRKIDREKRAVMVVEEAKKWTEKSPPVSPLSDIYTQIYISLADQMMYAYEDGELIISTPITSGRQSFETIRGTFKIYTKQRNKLMKSPFPDIEYELWVDYWIAFYGAYGIHDACNSRDCWRTVYGAKNYLYNGSHGCINTPYNAVRLIYNWSRIGTTVHVK